jgi:DNA-binding MarR family transcriptional regulator
MRTKLAEQELRAWQALLHSHDDVIGVLDSELRAEHGISLDAYDVLLRLVRAGANGLRMSQLAERVLVPPSTLTRRVDRLVADGFVERERLARDSRAVQVRLTERGRALLRRAARTHLGGIREHFTGRLTPQQLDEVASALEVITGPHLPH